MGWRYPYITVQRQRGWDLILCITLPSLILDRLKDTMQDFRRIVVLKCSFKIRDEVSRNKWLVLWRLVSDFKSVTIYSSNTKDTMQDFQWIVVLKCSFKTRDEASRNKWLVLRRLVSDFKSVTIYSSNTKDTMQDFQWIVVLKCSFIYSSNARNTMKNEWTNKYCFMFHCLGQL